MICLGLDCDEGKALILTRLPEQQRRVEKIFEKSLICFAKTR